MVAETKRQPDVELQSRRTSPLVTFILLVLVALTFLLRVWGLDTLPPGLFSDEAAYGVDVQEILDGRFQVFFPRNLGREPLFNYLAVPFVAVWSGRPIAIRLVSAILGTLMIPALFACGRALFRENPHVGVWAGLSAAALWTTNYWSQSVNRIAFHVNTLPLILTLAVVTWLNWTYRPTKLRAVAFGFMAGLTLATYLAARVTPILWLLLYFTLASPTRRALRGTLPWAGLAYLVTVSPLIGYFAFHPEELVTRIGGLASWMARPTLAEQAGVVLGSLAKVIGVFLGGAGDPLLRHNLPGRPPFPPYLVIPFALGLVSAVLRLRRRDQSAWTLLLWWPVLCLPGILAIEGNPHSLRLFGALPAVLLLAAWPIARLAEWIRGKSRHFAAVFAALLMLFIGVEGVRTTRDYFVTWAKDPELYYAFQEYIWLLGRRIAETPGAIGLLPLSPKFPPTLREYTLDYVFHETPIFQMQLIEADIEEWLADHLGNASDSRVLLPTGLAETIHEDPKGLLTFYLTREGSLESREPLRGFDLLTYSLKRVPQFQATGRRESLNKSFSSTVTLIGARWGVGFPNPDSDGDVAAAGTPVWAILTWRLERPSSDLKVTLDLVDDAGHRLGSSEIPLLNELGLPIPEWQTGTTGQTYHLVNVPATQPPGSVLLETRVYEAGSLVPLLPEENTSRRGSERLGTVTIAPVSDPQLADKVIAAHPMQLVTQSGTALVGMDSWPASIAPGQTLTLRFYWQVTTPLASSQVYTVSLGSTGVLGTVRVSPDLPVGHVVHTYVDLELPPGVAAGTHDLLLTSQASVAPTQLGQVTVAGRPHLFQVPDVRLPSHARFGDAVTLLGVDEGTELPGTPGQPVKLSLVWRAMGTPEQQLVRFVHLLGADGRPLAQQDSVPCTALCPASSWLPGEVLLDQAELVLPVDLPAGSYSLVVGWYDAALPQQRLPAEGADGQPLQGGVVVLPLKVVIAP